MTFEDRRGAGRVLAAALRAYRGSDAVVLGISRGGIIVAQEVARLLQMPLAVLVIQRIVEPAQPHLGVGAVSARGHLAVNRRRLHALGLTAGWLRPAVEQGTHMAAARALTYGALYPQPAVRGRRVIVVDDCATTGATVRAALTDVRAQGPREVVLALPVAPPRTLERLRGRVDRLVCAATPAELIARGSRYPAPLPMSDEAICALLDQAAPPTGSTGEPGDSERP